jgi:hypothetical protein
MKQAAQSDHEPSSKLQLINEAVNNDTGNAHRTLQCTMNQRQRTTDQKVSEIREGYAETPRQGTVLASAI